VTLLPLRRFRALQVAVIPAKAGIHPGESGRGKDCGVDSRFRGNDQRLGNDAIPNDTNTDG